MDILLIVILGMLFGLIDRFREVCTFASWTYGWLDYLEVEPVSAVWFWWLSFDDYEQPQWYNYLWRDGYHYFKYLLVVTVFLTLIAYDWRWVFGAIAGGVMQWFFGRWINKRKRL